ncbi:MAG TPA: lipid A-modifier LpxR family protein, partial [Nitrosopumilaceae archaeon]|nr:lipid A-modifier LpxR family protein [Nitrosopumilaceae archaeon]
EEQKDIHRWTKNIQPLGWQYQISNDIILNYSIQYEKGFLNSNYFELIGLTKIRLGTLYDDLSTGFLIRTGIMNSYFVNLGLVNQPNNKLHNFRCYFFAKGEIKAIGYNATMEGGALNKKSIYTIPPQDIDRFTGILYTGITISYKRLALEYTQSFLTPEFKNGLPHGWGHCNITVCF